MPRAGARSWSLEAQGPSGRRACPPRGDGPSAFPSGMPLPVRKHHTDLTFPRSQDTAGEQKANPKPSPAAPAPQGPEQPRLPHCVPSAAASLVPRQGRWSLRLKPFKDFTHDKGAWARKRVRPSALDLPLAVAAPQASPSGRAGAPSADAPPPPPL